MVQENKNKQMDAMAKTTPSQNQKQFGSAASADSQTNLCMQEWQRVRSRLRAELGEATFNSWFQSLTATKPNNKRVILHAPTPFIGSWIETHYLPRILNHWKSENKIVKRIEIMARDHMPQTEPAPIVRPQPVYRPRSKPVFETHSRDDIGAPLNPHYTFDNFITGKSNELAHAAARRVAEVGEVVFNPLFLYGGVGLGKTHLMHAIAWEIRRSTPDRRVLYVSAEKFMYHFVRAVRFKDTMTFKQQFREVDVLMVDDIQFIAGKESTQEEFFHTFNTLFDKNHQVIISADRSPSDLEDIGDRICSRLGCGLVADIHPTDYELRLGILQSKADNLLRNNKEIAVTEDVLEFLARRISSNVRDLEGALRRIIASASFNSKLITIEMAKSELRDLLRTSAKQVTVEEIQRIVADYYNLRMSEMLSTRRAQIIARPRQIAMYLCKQLTMLSLPEIGRKFGGRDHTTVIHAVNRIQELCQTDATINEDVASLRRRLEA